MSACRAGSEAAFSFGTTITSEQVNYFGDAYDGGARGEFRGHTVAVKDLPANAWGLYQMHGNVWEWCADAWRQYTDQAVLDPGLAQALRMAHVKDAARVLRGGGWFNLALLARSAYRCRDVPDGLDGYTGLRLALRS